MLRIESAYSTDVECTFHPIITAAGSNRQKRTPDDMCTGDLAKKREKEREIKGEIEKVELHPCTFEPVLNKNNTARSKLDILNNRDTYVQRAKLLDHTFSENSRKLKEESHIMEIAECTFQPDVRGLPKYISRLIESTNNEKAGKSQRNANRVMVPEWR